MEHQQPNSTLQQFSEAQSVPTDIIVEILLRLPVDSVLRCKSVCKSWCSLVSDPHFIKSHLAIATRSNNHYRQHRLVFSTGIRAWVESCNLHDVLYDNSSINNALDLNYPFRHLLKIPKIVGSCNGLLCIVVHEDVLFIWNPSTRISYILPPTGTSRNWIDWYVVYGFGYDESTDDYKVVELSNRFVDPCETFFKIYSLKGGNWKEIDAFPHGFRFHGDHGSFSNGAIHWIAGKDLGPRIVVSLDLEKETYGEVLQPVYDAGLKYLTLGSFREQLCVLCRYYRTRADLWVMKVYGMKDSWTKLVSIPYVGDRLMDQRLMPLCISNNGKLLLQLGPVGWSKLIVYDSKKGSFSEIQNYNNCHQASTFVESLVSPMPPPPPGCSRSRR